MSEPQESHHQGPHSTPAGESWREMGRQFQQLGESLSAAFRAAWNDEEVRRHAQGAQDGLEALAQEVGKVVTEMAQSPRLRQAADSAVKSARTAGEDTVQEIRPHVVDALRQLNQELQKFIDKIEAGKPQGSG